MYTSASGLLKSLLPLTLLAWNMHFNKPLADVYITTYSIGLEQALQ
jgi:hypothetical protein